MELKVLLPLRQGLQTSAVRISAEGPDGCFTLLPAHVDLLTAIVPGLLTYQVAPSQPERWVAVGAGSLVKCGSSVVVAVRRMEWIDES